MSRTYNFTRKENVKLCHDNMMLSSETNESHMTCRLNLSGSQNETSVDDITKQFNSTLNIGNNEKKIISLKNEQPVIPIKVEKAESVDSDHSSDSEDEDTSSNILIGRGPDHSEKLRVRSEPYRASKPSRSPYYSSESSLGSPLSTTSSNDNYSYTGSLTIFPNTVTDEENGLSISPNRRQYVHKNGGEVQIASIASSNSYSVSPTRYTLSPTSDYSSSGSQYESDATTDSSCILISEESNDNFDKVADFIEEHSAKGDLKVDHKIFHDEIEKILNDLEKKEVEDENDVKIIAEMCPVPVTVVETEKMLRSEVINRSCPVQNEQFQTAVMGNVMVNNNSMMQQVLFTDGRVQTYFISPPCLGSAMATTYGRFMPIKPKCEMPLNLYINGMNSKLDTDEIRKNILSKYPEEKKRDIFCWASKLSDDQLIHGNDDDGNRLLHIAINKQLEVVVVAIINVMSQLDVKLLDVRNNNGETPLFIAARSGQDKLVEYLLAKGANPNELCLQNGETILHYVAQYGNYYLPIMEILHRCSNTKIDEYNQLGKTPLILAIESHGRPKKINENHTQIIDSLPAVRFLIHHGASVASQDRRSGKTAIHVAVENKCLPVLEVLCKEVFEINKAVNEANYSGQTPLHYAAVLNCLIEREQVKIIKLLLNAGACTKKMNREHKTAADLVDKGRDEVKKLLSNRQKRAK